MIENLVKAVFIGAAVTIVLSLVLCVIIAIKEAFGVVAVVFAIIFVFVTFLAFSELQRSGRPK
jgi:uncharacterized membrane protein